MVAVVAHDLRNPLHTITIGLETMLKLPLPDDERANRQLVIMQHSVRSMNRLILDLLDVTRIELAGRGTTFHFTIPYARADRS